MDEFKPTKEQAQHQEIIEDSKAEHALSRSGSDGLPVNLDAVFDYNRKLTEVNLRGGQVLKGWKGIFGGLIFMLAGVGVGFQGYEAYVNSALFARVGMLFLASIFFLVGLLFFSSGVRSLIHRLQLKTLKPGQSTWKAEFPGDNREAKNESGPVAFKYLRNFLIGEVFLLPTVCFGWVKAFQDQSIGIGFLALLGTVWNLMAAYVTFNKSNAFMGSRKLKLSLSRFPFFLGQDAEMTLSTNNEKSRVKIARITLKCVVEENVESYASDPRNRTVSRAAFQLYAEYRKSQSSSDKAQKIKLAFKLPDRPELTTSLLSDDPVYWLLTVEGSCDDLPIDTAFLVPVYKQV